MVTIGEKWEVWNEWKLYCGWVAAVVVVVLVMDDDGGGGRGGSGGGDRW